MCLEEAKNKIKEKEDKNRYSEEVLVNGGDKIKKQKEKVKKP